MCGGGGIGSVVSGIGKSISNAVSSVGSAISTVVKNPVFQAVAPIALNYFLPGLGAAATGALGISSAWAPAIGGAISGGVFGAIGGGGLGGALKGAALGGVASGVADYALNGNNPLSGMFSETAGGAANNPLTAGGTGSTNLTGTGSGLGIDKGTLGTQFGQLGAGSTGTGGAGGINFSANGAEGGLNAPTGAPNLGGSSGSGSGVLSGLLDKAKSLVPDSTLGKVALGGTALLALNGMGKKPEQQAAPPSTPPGQDPSFNQHLQQMNFNYNPLTSRQNPANLQNYGVDFSKYDPKTNKFVTGPSGQNQNAPEFNFFGNPGLNQTETSVGGRSYTPAQAGGGLTPYYANGGLAQYASYADGGMPDVATDHGYLQGPGDGVSDDIPATIGDSQPARLAGGEFIIPSKIVAEIGNGSSDAGASRLHQMMERINKKRLSSKDWAKDTKAYNELPA